MVLLALRNLKHLLLELLHGALGKVLNMAKELRKFREFRVLVALMALHTLHESCVLHSELGAALAEIRDQIPSIPATPTGLEV